MLYKNVSACVRACARADGSKRCPKKVGIYSGE